MVILQDLKLYLENDLKALDQKILEYFQNREALIKIIGDYIVNSGGKKIRSIFSLLAFKMLSDVEPDDKIINSCAAIELIHMATLLHDDVVDGSKTRRSLPSANVVWGVNASILVGDFLLSQAFNFLVSVKSLKVLDVLAKTSSLIIEGEVVQLSQLKKKKIFSQEEYFHIIDLKTAKLFSAAFEVSSILSFQENYSDKLKQYGLLVGRIFQITDDVMDYGFGLTSLGKSPGGDFQEGKVTLPVIILHNFLTLEDKSKLEVMFQYTERNDEEFQWIKQQMINLKINEHIKKILAQLERESQSLLKSLNIRNQNFSYVQQLTNFIVNRI
ncbi:MAG: polyprenyl synthetase family protein [Rickettsia sp.]|nr:polyprenyl synthetase family protein [Rickettsia sp.]